MFVDTGITYYHIHGVNVTRRIHAPQEFCEMSLFTVDDKSLVYLFHNRKTTLLERGEVFGKMLAWLRSKPHDLSAFKMY